jgi:hypothetical protein
VRSGGPHRQRSGYLLGDSLLLKAFATLLSVIEAGPLTEPAGKPSLVHLVRRDDQHRGFGFVHVRWVRSPSATVELYEHDEARQSAAFVPVA